MMMIMYKMIHWLVTYKENWQKKKEVLVPKMKVFLKLKKRNVKNGKSLMPLRRLQIKLRGVRQEDGFENDIVITDTVVV